MGRAGPVGRGVGRARTDRRSPRAWGVWLLGQGPPGGRAAPRPPVAGPALPAPGDAVPLRELFSSDRRVGFTALVTPRGGGKEPGQPGPSGLDRGRAKGTDQPRSRASSLWGMLIRGCAPCSSFMQAPGKAGAAAAAP